MIPHSHAGRYSLAPSLQSRDEPWTTDLADLVRGGFKGERAQEISVLSPSVQPVETRARIVILKREPATPDPHGVVFYGDGRSLHRYSETEITVR